MAFVQHVDDALVLALSSLRMNYNINNNDDNNYSNNDNKISISTDNRNNACMTYSYTCNLHHSSLSPLSTALSIFDHSQTYHTISQLDYKMNIADIYNDDGHTDSLPSLKSLVFDKKIHC